MYRWDSKLYWYLNQQSISEQRQTHLQIKDNVSDHKLAQSIRNLIHTFKWILKIDYINMSVLKVVSNTINQTINQYVSIPKWNWSKTDYWQITICKSNNDIDFAPKPIAQLVKVLHDVVRVLFVDMRVTLYGTGKYELRGPYRKHFVSFQVWNSKTGPQQDAMVKSEWLLFYANSAIFQL